MAEGGGGGGGVALAVLGFVPKSRKRVEGSAWGLQKAKLSIQLLTKMLKIISRLMSTAF